MKIQRQIDDDQPLAELRGAVKRYGAVTALAGVDFAVQPGEVVALLGPNGAGKTTAGQLLLGLIRPSGGEGRLGGQDPRAPAARGRGGATPPVSQGPETLKGEDHVHPIS